MIKVEEISKEMTFPRLMTSKTSTLVLFRTPGKGTVLDSKNEDEIGLYSEEWDMNCFEDFIGVASLENE